MKNPITYILKIEWFLIWTNFNSLHPRMLWANFGEIGSVVLEKKIF